METIDYTHKPESYLYRITDIKYVIDSFLNQHLIFVKIGKWPDKQEILTDYVIDGKIGVLNPQFRNSIYGICWTADPSESAAMWQLYSRDYRGVRIKVKESILKELMLKKQIEILKENRLSTNYVASSDNHWNNDAIKMHQWICSEMSTLNKSACYADDYETSELNNIPYGIRAVEYVPLDKLKKKACSNSIIEDCIFRNSNFFAKNEAYAFEKETRTILYKDNSEHEDLLKMQITPCDLYEEIVFDSRMTNCEFELYKEYLTNTLKYPVDKIKKSNVFDTPTYMYM